MQENALSLQDRLARAGITIPRPELTRFDYLPVAFHDRIAYLAGQIPKVGNDVLHAGRVGETVSYEQAREAAEVATGQALAWVERTCGGLENVERVLRMDFFIAVADDFERMSEVADAASGLLGTVFGESGRHPRSVIGVSRLPRNSSVLIELTFALRQRCDDQQPA